MSGDAFDRASWERRWAQVIREQPEMVAGRPPSAYVVDAIDAMGPGRALDAGCGHGAEAIGLAASGWQVTAVDFSPSALEHGRTTAAAVGADVSARIEWIEADLGTWAPPPRRFDLVSCLYVHAAGSVREMVARLATGVAPGGTLLLVGHLPVDPATGGPSRAAGQVQVTVPEALEALGARDWDVLTAEDRQRPGGDGADAVVRARYRGRLSGFAWVEAGSGRTPP